MRSKSYRLDRFIRERSSYEMSDTRLLIAQGRILIDGEPAHSIRQIVSCFAHIVLDGECLQRNEPIYLMVNKPKGVVCATRDTKHTTIVDIVDHPEKESLHIVGRLDFNTTGLVLMTNDGAWSRAVSLPDSKLKKIYEVRVKSPLSQTYVDVFSDGIYFPYEDITTAPATLEIHTPYTATLSLTEGKYHQIKRMFGHFQNEVLALHRTAVGHIELDSTLKPGDGRPLSTKEIAL